MIQQQSCDCNTHIKWKLPFKVDLSEKEPWGMSADVEPNIIHPVIGLSYYFGPLSENGELWFHVKEGITASGPAHANG